MLETRYNHYIESTTHKGIIMSNIQHPDDEVNGVIVGGDFGMCWVTYDGRKQGKTCYPRNEAEAYSMCNEIKDRINRECWQVFKDIFPLDSWMFHFDGI